MKVKKNLWVIYHKKNTENILISLLSGRKGSTQIIDYLEQVWIDKFLNFNERVNILNSKKNLPYRATAMPYSDIPSSVRFYCGYNGAEIRAIYCTAYQLEGKITKFYYRIPTAYDWETNTTTTEEFTFDITRL